MRALCTTIPPVFIHAASSTLINTCIIIFVLVMSVNSLVAYGVALRPHNQES